MESFSKSVKEELSKLNNLSDKKLVKYELQGYLLTSDSNKFTTENEYNINRFRDESSQIYSPQIYFVVQMTGNRPVVCVLKVFSI